MSRDLRHPPRAPRRDSTPHSDRHTRRKEWSMHGSIRRWALGAVLATVARRRRVQRRIRRGQRRWRGAGGGRPGEGRGDALGVQDRPGGDLGAGRSAGRVHRDEPRSGAALVRRRRDGKTYATDLIDPNGTATLDVPALDAGTYTAYLHRARSQGSGDGGDGDGRLGHGATAPVASGSMSSEHDRAADGRHAQGGGGGVPAGNQTDTQGNQLLEPTMDGNTKVFDAHGAERQVGDLEGAVRRRDGVQRADPGSADRRQLRRPHPDRPAEPAGPATTVCTSTG